MLTWTLWLYLIKMIAQVVLRMVLVVVDIDVYVDVEVYVDLFWCSFWWRCLYWYWYWLHNLRKGCVTGGEVVWSGWDTLRVMWDVRSCVAWQVHIVWNVNTEACKALVHSAFGNRVLLKMKTISFLWARFWDPIISMYEEPKYLFGNLCF